MKKTTKQEILSRMLVCSSLLVLSAPFVSQPMIGITASAETMSTSTTDKPTIETGEALPDQQLSAEEEQAATVETVDSESEFAESMEETSTSIEESTATTETKASSTEEKAKAKAALEEKADIQNLEVSFTDETGETTLKDGDELPLKANGSNSAVGAKISFTLDTTGYQSGDKITIDRIILINGEVSTGAIGVGGAISIAPFDVVDSNSGKVLGTFSANPGGNIVFTLTAAAIEAGEIDVSALLPTVLSTGGLPTTGDYQITIGDSTIHLVSPGVGFNTHNENSNHSTDGSQQWISNANTTRVLWGIRNDYSGHIAQQTTPNQYTNSTGGIITNISDNEITDVAVQNQNYRVVSFWSNGELQSTRIISQKGSTPILSADYLGGVNNNEYVDASNKLTADMTVQEAQEALSPGEWGSIKLPDGSWLWAYKTGDPSEGTTLDGPALVEALKASGVVMTDEDVARTIAQTQFIASTNDYLSVTFADSTKNGTAMNTMGNGTLKGSTVLPAADSEVLGRIMVSYVDDTTGALLSADTDKGTTGTTSTYSTNQKIADYVSKGYKLVSDNYSTNPVTFGGLGSLQQFEVHLVHDTEAGNPETKTVERTIHYVYKDGSTAAEDKKEILTFTRTTAKDLVTGNTVYSDWNAKDNDTTFDEVISPTIDKYTPDKAKIEEITGVSEKTEDSEVTVTYSADIETTTETKEVKRVIHYVYEDDTEAAPDSTDVITFTRIVTKNPDTGETTYSDWEAKDDDTTFDEVKSPEIDNYTPDKDSISEVTDLTEASKDIEETVTYTAKMDEHIETKKINRVIHYIYEDGKEAASDKTDQVTFTRIVTKNLATGEITYGEWAASDDDTTFDEVKSPEIDNYTPDKDSISEVTDLTEASKDIEETVTYLAKMETTTETKEVERVIHYVYEDGKEAAKDKTDSVSFTRTVTKNLATGEVTYSEWKAKDDDTTFDEVVSPEIGGYVSDKKVVEEVKDVEADDKDLEETVTYKRLASAPSTEEPSDSTTPSSEETSESTTTTTETSDATTASSESKDKTTTAVPKSSGGGTTNQATITTKTSTSSKTLPSTGEKVRHYLTWFGGFAVSAAAILGVLANRSKRKVK